MIFLLICSGASLTLVLFASADPLYSAIENKSEGSSIHQSDHVLSSHRQGLFLSFYPTLVHSNHGIDAIDIDEDM